MVTVGMAGIAHTNLTLSKDMLLAKLAAVCEDSARYGHATLERDKHTNILELTRLLPSKSVQVRCHKNSSSEACCSWPPRFILNCVLLQIDGKTLFTILKTPGESYRHYGPGYPEYPCLRKKSRTQQKSLYRIENETMVLWGDHLRVMESLECWEHYPYF